MKLISLGKRILVVLFACAVVPAAQGGWGFCDDFNPSTFKGSCTNDVWKLSISRVTVGGVTGFQITSYVSGSGVLDLTGFGAETGSGLEVISLWREIFKSKTCITSFVGPSVIDIKRHAFYGATALASVTISPDVSMVEYSAFEGATALSSFSPLVFPSLVTVPDAMFCKTAVTGDFSFPVATTLGRNLFYKVAGVTSVSAPLCLTLGDQVFREATALTNFYGPSVTVLLPHPDNKTYGGAFRAATSLRSVTLSPNVDRLGDYCFSGASSLVELVPTNMACVANLGNSTFGGTSMLQVPLSFSKLNSLAINSFSGSGITSLSAPAATNIERAACSGCPNLKTVRVWGSQLTIAQEAFKNAPSGFVLEWLGPEAPGALGSSAIIVSSGLKATIFVRQPTALEGWLLLKKRVPNATDKATEGYPGRCTKGVLDSNGNKAWICQMPTGLLLLIR